MAHPDYIKQKAIQLRVEKKLTIDEIAERLSISRTTAFYWVGATPIPETRKQTSRRLAASRANSKNAERKRQEAYAQGLREYEELAGVPTFRDFVCMYIGEGTKRMRNYVAICNSDPAVMKLGQKWICQLSRNRVRYSVQYHADQEIGEVRRFWAEQLGIESAEINLQRKSNSGKLSGRTWRSKHGVLEVRSSDTYLRSRIEAWMDLVKAEWE